MRKMFFFVALYFLISFAFSVPYKLAYSEADILNSFNLNDPVYKVSIGFYVFLLIVPIKI